MNKGVLANWAATSRENKLKSIEQMKEILLGLRKDTESRKHVNEHLKAKLQESQATLTKYIEQLKAISNSLDSNAKKNVEFATNKNSNDDQRLA